MPYSNINVGQKKSVRQKEYDDFLQQLVKNKKRDRSRRGLEDASGAFNNKTAGEQAVSDAYENSGIPSVNDEWVDDYYNQAEGSEDVASLVAKAEAEVSPQEQNAQEVIKGSGPSYNEQAAAKAANMPNNEGYNPQGSLFTGPNNTHYTDMERVNAGLQPSQADDLRDAMNTDRSFESAARMLPYKDELDVKANKGIIATQDQLSKYVSNQLGFMSTGFGSKNSREFVERVAEDTNQDPQSVAEWFQTVLTDNQTLKDGGYKQVFSDAALAAVLHVMKKNRWAQFNRDEKIKDGELGAQDSESEVNTSIAHDEEIGGLIETAFGKKDSSAQTRAITGAIARRIVTDALGGYELDNKVHGMTLNKPWLASEAGQTIYEPISGRIREVSPEGHVKAGLFHSKKIKINGKDDLWVTELTDIGLNHAMELETLGNIILPGLRKDVNARPPLTEEGFPKMSSKKSQRRQDKDRPTGPAKSTNEGIHAMESVGNAIDQEYGSRLLATLNNKEAVDILLTKKYINLVGLELPTGQVIRVDAKGNAFAQEWRLDSNGNKIPNPRYNPNEAESNELEFETKPLMGDKAKMANFQQDIQWIQDHFDDTAFFYTYFIGGAKRVHVEQTIGNYQNSKLVRSLLQAAVKRDYKVNNTQDMVDLQAGILKKLGMNKANEGSNVQLSSKFKNLAADWSSKQQAFLDQGGQGFAPELVKEAATHEGWMSLSAISEAIDLHNFQREASKGGPSLYRTGFITEIDGLANGLAINSMQAGDLRVAGLTGMIPIEGGEYSLENDDVYTITTSMFKQQINSYAGKNLSSKFGKIWEVAFEDMFNENDRDNYREPSKTALMIFGYGAGDDTINGSFVEFLSEKIEGNVELKAMINSYGAGAMTKFLELSGKMMVKSVQTNFPEMQELAKVLSSISGYAASIGIEPHVISADYDWVEFGLSQRVKDNRFSGSYEAGKRIDGKARKGRPGSIDVQTMRRFLDSQGVEVKGSDGQTLRVKFDAAVHKIANLKAAKQAPVLITQSIDAIVMMRAIANLKKNSKAKGGFFAAQIYDGILMTPKDAREFSEALHKEIMYVSKHYSSIHSLIESIEDLDKERFREVARLTKIEKTGRELTVKEKEEIENSPMRFFLSQVPWKGKKGDTIIESIRRLDARRAEAVKKMDLKKMYQYAWDWPSSKK